MRIKKKIIEASHLLINIGHNIGSEGNISQRVGDKIYITPSGIKTLNLNIKNISELDLDGNILNNIRPSSEFLLHLLIYKNFKNINSVVHSHSTWASIISCLRINISPFHYMIAEFGGDNIRCAKYATFGTKQLSINVNTALKNRKGCLIANHGQITLGENLEESIDLSIAMEKICKQFYYGLFTKKLKILNKKQMLEVIELFKDYKPKR
jgi:L-fuculose-phosphate aldolase